MSNGSKKCLKKVGYSKSLKSKASNFSLDINGNSTSDKKEVAEELNTHFATVAKELVDNHPQLSGIYGEKHYR